MQWIINKRINNTNTRKEQQQQEQGISKSNIYCRQQHQATTKTKAIYSVNIIKLVVNKCEITKIKHTHAHINAQINCLTEKSTKKKGDRKQQ